MQINELTPLTFSADYEKMCCSFPYEERRDITDEAMCFNKKEFRFCRLTENGEPCGVAVFWEFEGFIFLEHLAVDENMRSLGLGSRFIELLKKSYNKSIILEAEPPETEQAKRRIAFYERHGFFVNDYFYEQPSYHGENAGVRLNILSFPNTLSQGEFDGFLKTTRREVYGITDYTG